MTRCILALSLMFSSQSLTAGGKAPLSLPVWPELTSASSNETIEERSKDPGRLDRALGNVTVPELTITWPQQPKGPAPAAVICPGGGYSKVVIDKEGYAIAKWLNDLGFVAAVLKYRLPVAGGKQTEVPFPIQDGQQAIRILRHHAAEWGIDPNRIGIMGSSAGGHLASTVATHFSTLPAPSRSPLAAVSARPDFQMLLYPVISLDDQELAHVGSRQMLLGDNPDPEKVRFYSNDSQVTAETPPAFLVHAEDDKGVPIGNSLKYRDALEKAGVPVEVLILKTGGHGFGLGRPGNDSEDWSKTGEAWLRQWTRPSQETP